MVEKLLPPAAGPVAPSGPAKSGPLPSDLLTSSLPDPPDALPEDPALRLCDKHLKLMNTQVYGDNEEQWYQKLFLKLTPLLLPTNGATKLSMDPLSLPPLPPPPPPLSEDSAASNYKVISNCHIYLLWTMALI